MIPKLRFPEFNKATDYLVCEFSDLFEFSSGKSIKQSEASEEFKTPCVRYGELYHMYSEVIDDVVNRTNLDRVELRFSLGNEILLPSAGEDPLDIGSASALTLPNIAIGRTINVLRPKRINTYSHIYVSYYINEKLKKKIATLAKGVSISNVYNTDLRTLQAVLPSLAEQNKVASFIRKVDQKINLLTKKKEALETYKKGLMQKIFSQELRFKREDGTDYPEWDSIILSEIAEIQKGKQLNRLDMDENGAFPVLNGGIKWSGFTTSYNTKAKTIAISEGGNSCGYVSFVTTDFWSGGHNYTLELQNDLNVKYLYHFLKYKEVDIMRLRVGSGLPNIQKKDLKRFLCDIPCLEEQRGITYILDNLDSQVNRITRKIDSSERMKKGLLQQMFV